MTIYAWTPCSDGTIKKVDATSVVMSVDTGCTETWIASANKLALVPGRRGEIVSMNGLGTIKDRRTLQHRIAIAVGVVNDVYCFDGRGKGTIVTLDNNGLITVGEKFTCSGVVDPMNAILDGTAIYIACRSEDVYSFETTTQVTTRISRNRDDVLTSVVDNNTITKLRNNAIYARLFGGAVIGGTDYFVGNGAIHTSTSRIVDSRIRSDGICIPVGSDGTQFIKSCPSRESMQWVTGATVSSEVTGVLSSGNAIFSLADATSNESNALPGSGGFGGGEALDDVPLYWNGDKLHFFETNGNTKILSAIGNGGSVDLTSCGYTGYMAFGPGASGVDCDVWQALRDGAWSGSVTFEVRISYNTGASLFKVGRRTGGAGVFGTPYYQTTNAVAPSGSCASYAGLPVRYVTIFESGQMSVT